MSAISPEFINFIKKLEDNGDKLPAVTPLEQPVEFEFNNSPCHVCNGYYGPSFGEPVCVTCHAFLFPDFPSYLPSSYFCSEKTDDGDSGNDEPSDLNFGSDRKVNKACPVPGWWYYRNSLDSETSPEDEASRASNSGPGVSGSGSGGSAGGVPRHAGVVGVKGDHAMGVAISKEGITGGVKGAEASRASNSGPGPSGSGSAGGVRRDAGVKGDHATGVASCKEGVSGGVKGDDAVASTAGGSHGDPLAGPAVGTGAIGVRGVIELSRAASGATAAVPAASGSGVGAGTVARGLGPVAGGVGTAAVGARLAAGGVGLTGGAGAPEAGQGAPEAGQGPPPPPHSLAHSLHALSTPRPLDNLAPGLVEQLPSEVMLCIFSYLDDMSLCACASVCARWWWLVRARVPPPRWAAFAARRWPLYRPIFANIDWHKKYQALVESCFCRNCLVQMCVQAQPAGDENAWRRNRLRTELKMMRNDPPEGIAATPLDPNCCHWQASVTGPVGSPYEGGIFYLYIQVPYSYPMSPPVVRFLTRILHPNVSRHGDVGIDSVHHNWSLALTISKVLISIQSLLTDPYTAVCMEPELGEMYVRDRVRFEALARRWTWRYAMHDILPY